MFKLFKSIGDIRRLGEIASALVDLGLIVLVKKLRLRHCLSLRCRVRCFFRGAKSCPHEEIPVRIRLILERLGPTFIKLGQILSVRPDFVPLEYIRELEKLQDNVPSFSYNQVKKIIETELKKPISKIFKEFDKQPLAAASLSQVHKAKLLNGKIVAVKVQRPGIKKTIEKDMRIISHVAALLEKFVSETRNYRPTAAAKEFASYTMKELDFVIEGKNADRFRYNFRNDKGVKVPLVYWEHSTSKVLTMELIKGVKMGDLKGMKKLGINHKILTKNCTRACTEPFFVHGFFHADPHPGNMWVLKDNSVCYLDFGMVGVITSDLKRTMLLHFMALINQEVSAALRHLLELAEVDEDSDVSGFKKEAEDLIIALYVDSTKRETLAKTFFKIVSVAAKHGIVFPSNLILLAKALMTAETMCMVTHPNFDFLESMKPTMQKIIRKEFGPEKVFKSFQESLPYFFSFLEKLPDIIKNLTNKLETGEIDINLKQKKKCK